MQIRFRSKVVHRILSLSLLALLGLSSNLSLSSCGSDSGTPGVSDVEVKLNTQRFDQDIAKLDTNQLGAGLQNLQKKYPQFLDFWLDELMQFGVQGDYSDTASSVRNYLRVFLTHHDFRGLFDSVAKHFPDTKDINENLTNGFKYYKHYYPHASVPRVIYFVSGLNNWSAVTVDTSILAIGLDMYLGEQYPFYKAVGIPEYMYPQLVPDAIPVNAFRAIYQDRHPFVAEDKTLLDLMIQRGKEQYFLSKILPFVSEARRLSFTEAQLKWSQENEGLAYNFLFQQKFLYEKNWAKIMRYVNDGPQATGMPEGSPGNIGTYLGYQIILSYMKKHPDTSMEALFALSDPQVLLQEAQYKPR